jgi:hypothetical protein
MARLDTRLAALARPAMTFLDYWVVLGLIFVAAVVMIAGIR